MKNEKIRRINTIGKVSKILLLIIIILSALVTFAMIVCSFAAIPLTTYTEDAIKINGSGSFEVSIDTEKIPFFSLVESKIDSNFEKLNFDYFGVNADVEKNESQNSEESEDKIITYSGDFGLDNIKIFLKIVPVGVFTIALTSTVFMIIMIFAWRLAAAFAVCNSPFETNVIKKMKYFAFSMIPWALLKISDGKSSMITAVIMTIIILLLVYIFSYGAQLQQESDDTV